ncbi:MAG: hypothetical protein IJ131_02425 [Eggerthellaceae bacterium]|nr:hypothetical protein [Eggerthellaceae bacterium]
MADLVSIISPRLMLADAAAFAARLFGRPKSSLRIRSEGAARYIANSAKKGPDAVELSATVIEIRADAFEESGRQEDADTQREALLEGLAEAARQDGCNFRTLARVVENDAAQRGVDDDFAASELLYRDVIKYREAAFEHSGLEGDFEELMTAYSLHCDVAAVYPFWECCQVCRDRVPTRKPPLRCPALIRLAGEGAYVE